MADETITGSKAFAIVAGFGIPGREVVNLLTQRGIEFVVVELNSATVARCRSAGLNIVQGDIADEQVLRNAGIEKATLVALAIPDDAAVLRAVEKIRRLNPAARILARCRRVSTALEATRRGAEDVVSEEQLIGAEFARLTTSLLS